MTHLRLFHFRFAICLLLLPSAVAAEEPFAGSACTLIGESNCQLPAVDFGSGYLSNLHDSFFGILVADDFVPEATALTQLCVWGFYNDAPESSSTDDNVDCLIAVPDRFRVRVFSDNAGLPGELIADVASRFMDVQRSPATGTGFENQFGSVTSAVPQAYTLTLDEPITGLVPGQRHWLEVANSTSRWTREGPKCGWHWLQHFPQTGDGYSATGVANPRSYSPDVSIYVPGSEKPSDLAFCLGTTDGPLAFSSGPPVTGACWTCGGEELPACNVATALGCVSDTGLRGLWNRLDPNCSGSFDDVSGRIVGDSCDESEGGATFITEGLHALDTRCASGSGSIDTQDGGDLEVGNDLWLYYTATCTGWVKADGCLTQSGITQHGFDLSDSGLALYRDPLDPSVCVCPGSGVEPVRAATENCNGLPDFGSAVLEAITYPGECWTIRIAHFIEAGSATNSGPVLLDIECESAPCYLALPLESEQISDEFGVPQSNLKNRYLSIASVDVWREQALRVEFVDLPSPYDVWNGSKFWVGEPFTLGSSGLAREEFNGALQLAPLVCDEHPYTTDWNGLGIVHVYHEGIVPGGVYEIQALDATANPAIERCYSGPLILRTADLGDTTGGCTSSLCFPADDAVDIGDALAILGRFASTPGSIIVPRADLEPACVDFEINVSDVLMSIRGFIGQSYPFAPSAADPCDATCALP